MFNPEEQYMLLVPGALLVDLMRQLQLAHDAIRPLAEGEPISVEAQISLSAVAQLAIEQAMRDAALLRPAGRIRNEQDRNPESVR